jgi:hypothetical protein
MADSTLNTPRMAWGQRPQSRLLQRPQSRLLQRPLNRLLLQLSHACPLLASFCPPISHTTSLLYFVASMYLRCLGS